MRRGLMGVEYIAIVGIAFLLFTLGSSISDHGPVNQCGDTYCKYPESVLTCPQDCDCNDNNACTNDFLNVESQCASTPVSCGQTCIPCPGGAESCLPNSCSVETGCYESTPACPSSCGDGACDSGETSETCSEDCPLTPTPATCGDSVCEDGETSETCSEDCGPSIYCGNGACEGSEDCSSCASDCGLCVTTCGDGVCEGSEATTCPSDCTIPTCGDGACDSSEDCSSCASDCGTCSTGGSTGTKGTTSGSNFRGITVDLKHDTKPKEHLTVPGVKETSGTHYTIPKLVDGEVIVDGTISSQDTLIIDVEVTEGSVKVAVEPDKSISNAQIVTRSLEDDKAALSHDYKTDIFQVLELSTKDAAQTPFTGTFTVTFSVTTEWLTKNNIAKEDVAFARIEADGSLTPADVTNTIGNVFEATLTSFSKWIVVDFNAIASIKCNQNGICDESETALSCPRDCAESEPECVIGERTCLGDLYECRSPGKRVQIEKCPFGCSEEHCLSEGESPDSFPLMTIAIVVIVAVLLMGGTLTFLFLRG